MNFFYNDVKEKIHHEYFPESFRMLIVGQSGAGKTAMLMRLLLTPGLLNYDKLYVFARSLHQAEYQCLMEGFENKLHKLDVQDMLGVGDLIRKKKSSIKEVAVGLREHNDENGIEPSTVEAKFYSSSNEVPDPAGLDRSARNLMVFDDIMTDGNKRLPKITIRGVEAVTVTRSTSLKIILVFRCTRLDLMQTL